MTSPEARLFIGGRFVEPTGPRHPVFDPSRRTLVAEVARASDSDVEAALDAAARAVPLLRASTFPARGALVRALADAVRAAREPLAQLLTAEQGKPLAEARAEIQYGLGYFDYYAELAQHVTGEVLPSPSPTDRLLVVPEPIGVCVAITPWNFPFAMLARKVAPALVAGNPVILKPAEATPLTALAFAALAAEVGLPDGALSVLTGDRDDAARIGRRLLADGRVRKLSFTGSTVVGKALYAACADTVKRVSLELGGNAAFLVFADADLDAAVDGVVQAKFRNAGQACVAANRILVDGRVRGAFVERLVARVEAMRVGDGRDADTTLGPLIDARARAKVVRHRDDALARGATAVVPGGPVGEEGSFYAPTVLEGVPFDALLHAEETFGPLAAVSSFEREDEAVAHANDTPFGLAGYVYSRDIGRANRVADALEVGMVAVNAGLLSSALAPFGGVKESGLGKEGGRAGLDAYLVHKYLRFGGL